MGAEYSLLIVGTAVISVASFIVIIMSLIALYYSIKVLGAYIKINDRGGDLWIFSKKQ